MKKSDNFTGNRMTLDDYLLRENRHEFSYMIKNLVEKDKWNSLTGEEKLCKAIFGDSAYRQHILVSATKQTIDNYRLGLSMTLHNNIEGNIQIGESEMNVNCSRDDLEKMFEDTIRYIVKGCRSNDIEDVYNIEYLTEDMAHSFEQEQPIVINIIEKYHEENYGI